MRKNPDNPLLCLLQKQPDLSSGSNDIFFLNDEVIKFLKPTATLYQFCSGAGITEVLTLLELVKNQMIHAFGDAIIPTVYLSIDNTIVTRQKRFFGKTLKVLSKEATPHSLSLQNIDLGIAVLRKNWRGDRELLGYIIDEILDPTNILFDGNNIMIVDWI